jgi:hypothetical protein
MPQAGANEKDVLLGKYKSIYRGPNTFSFGCKSLFVC